MKEKRRPTVKAFNNRLKSLPREERQTQIYNMFRESMVEYHDSNKYMQEFYTNFIYRYREDFLHYLIYQTPYGSFLRKLENLELIYKICYLLKGDISTTDLAICLKLAFDIPYTFNTLTHKMRNNKIDESDLWEINCWVRGALK